MFLTTENDIILLQNIRDFNSHEFIYDSNCLSLLSLPRCLIKISSTLFQVCASRRSPITHAATRIKSHPCNAYTSSIIITRSIMKKQPHLNGPVLELLIDASLLKWLVQRNDIASICCIKHYWSSCYANKTTDPFCGKTGTI